MLDGRIDTQGTVKNLRAQGILEEIAHDESIEAQKETRAAETTSSMNEAHDTLQDTTQAEAKKPKKLVEDEKRAEGSVKWSVYKTYLKAS